MEGATYSNFEMKFKWSFCFLFLGYCDDKDSIMEQWRVQLIQIFKWRVNEVSVFLFLGYCDDIIDSIIEQYTKNTAELLEKSTSLKINAPPPLSASYEQADLEEAITAYRSRFQKNTLVH